MKIIDIENYKFATINHRLTKNHRLSKKYIATRDFLMLNCKNIKMIEPPYYVIIYQEMYKDIDNLTKCILDVLQKKKVIDNDRNVLFKPVFKFPRKKNEMDKLIVHVGKYDLLRIEGDYEKIRDYMLWDHYE